MKGLTQQILNDFAAEMEKEFDNDDGKYWLPASDAAIALWNTPEGRKWYQSQGITFEYRNLNDSSR